MSLGRNSYCGSDISAEIEVGNYTSIADQCHFHAPSDNHLCAIDRKVVFSINWDQPTGRHIKIGSDVWIARGVKVLPGVHIGDGAIIGAWSVVTKDVPPFAFVAGNPARIKRYRFTKRQIKKLLKIQWWNWSHEEVEKAKNDRYLYDIDKFLKKYDKTS